VSGFPSGIPLPGSVPGFSSGIPLPGSVPGFPSGIQAYLVSLQAPSTGKRAWLFFRHPSASLYREACLAFLVGPLCAPRPLF
jgi:hypothetical protein